jgi:hypothetical protein
MLVIILILVAVVGYLVYWNRRFKTILQTTMERNNAVNDLLQHLLFHPEHYNDHRKNFVEFVAAVKAPDDGHRFLAVANGLETMAQKLYPHTYPANIETRRELARR